MAGTLASAKTATSGNRLRTCFLDMNIQTKRLKVFNSRYTISRKCWKWNGTKHYSGYGCFKVAGKNWRVHRLMWMIEKGEIPDGLYVLHKCDVKSCVNPTHLFLGTAKDNLYDCISKGRFRVASGDVHGTKTHPERIARGKRHGSYTHPEKFRGPWQKTSALARRG